jgi:hypothetical protein
MSDDMGEAREGAVVAVICILSFLSFLSGTAAGWISRGLWG